jgi:DNA polymerase III subunit alpha
LYCHLHTHSCYSFLEGLAQPGDLVRAAGLGKMPALALTDHLGLTGALPFANACRSAGIKPIFGLEIDLLLPYRLSPAPNPAITGTLVLLAEDRHGWRSLCRLSSTLLCTEADILLPCTIDQLAAESTGLVCLTGGCRGAPQRALAHPHGLADARNLLDRLAGIFPGRLYVEIHRQSNGDERNNPVVLKLATDMRLPLLAAHNVYYLEPSGASLQRTVSAIRTNQSLDRLSPDDVAPEGAHFLSAGEMEARFADCPDALRGVEEIVERCNCTLDLGTPHYPSIPLPASLTPDGLLRQKAEAGARKLYGEIPPAVQARLEQELSVISARGYEPIFLIAEEMIAYAARTGVPSASRGSASSSLVAHCIGITTPDPLALDLYFERFLNPARTTPPDIDTDFCSRRRDDVINHLFETYGAEKVAMVGTINTYRPRSALGEVAKAHGFKPQEVRALTSQLHHRYWMHREDDPEENVPEENPFAELEARYARDPRYEILFREAVGLLGLPHHLSVHPGGVVIAPDSLTDYVPVARSGGKGVIITQFDHAGVEQCGLVKLDLLGIRGLTVLGDVAESIYSWRRKEYKSILHVLDAVPAEDPETSTLVTTGRTIGCFQIESPGMRATLKDIQARTPADIMAALALYRPGPLKGGLRDAFVRRYKKLEAVEHLHPALSSLLRETYGVILYQEQVLRIAHDLAGFSLAEADLLRRAMSHFDPGKQMQILKENFIRGAEERRGVPPETGARIWEMMAAFAGYGFPKAHAASYAQVAWRSAWCKAHYPAEFVAAVLANWGGYYPQSVYLSEARRLKLAVRPPHVNRSRRQFSVNYPDGEPVLYMGLDQVRALTRRTQERILRYRPFHTLGEFLLQVDPRRQEIENLIQTSALEGIGTIPDLLKELAGGRPRPGQLSLFASASPSGDDWTVEQKIDAQQRLLGISLERHPLELYAAQVKAAKAISTVEAVQHIGQPVRVAGMRQMVFRTRTAHNESMGFVTIEDLEGMLDVVLFPAVYARARGVLSSATYPLIIEGIMERDSSTGEPVLHAERVERLKQ